MKGKTVVIAGGTSGIGEIAAERLAQMGARIVLIARSKSRGKVTLARLHEKAPDLTHTVHYAGSDPHLSADLRPDRLCYLRRRHDPLQIFGDVEIGLVERQRHDDGRIFAENLADLERHHLVNIEARLDKDQVGHLRCAVADGIAECNVQGSVAKSTHAGIPWPRFIRQHGRRVHFWPFDGCDIRPRSAIAEVYPFAHRLLTGACKGFIRLDGAQGCGE
jgi:NAD(P)-dependent dehydrogenase (short-subunit alcohol dehydrogenase family)